MASSEMSSDVGWFQEEFADILALMFGETSGFSQNSEELTEFC
jgi:hypothetical protein